MTLAAATDLVTDLIELGAQEISIDSLNLVEDNWSLSIYDIHTEDKLAITQLFMDMHIAYHPFDYGIYAS